MASWFNAKLEKGKRVGFAHARSDASPAVKRAKSGRWAEDAARKPAERREYKHVVRQDFVFSPHGAARAERRAAYHSKLGG